MVSCDVCGGAGEEREEADSLPFGYAQGRNDKPEKQEQRQQQELRQGRLAILAIEKVAHGLPAGFVGLADGLAFVGVHAAFAAGLHGFGGAALGAAIGETGFVRFQLELFGADDTGFDRERHCAVPMIRL